MADALMAGQFVPSGCGFKFVRIRDIVEDYNSISQCVRFMEVRQWCRRHSQGTWCYTPCPSTVYLSQKDWQKMLSNRSRYRAHLSIRDSYFGFHDEFDLTAMRLALGDEGMKLKPVYPSNTKFTVFIRGLPDDYAVEELVDNITN
jgi:hypothetical protein